jgi:hypothetical protein
MSALPPSRFSVLSSSSADHLSPTNSSTRFSLVSAPSIATAAAGSPKPLSRPNIYDRPLNKTRTAEVSASAFAFLFSEVVQYMQKRVSGINDLERRCAKTILLTRIILRPNHLPKLEHSGISNWHSCFGTNGMACRVWVQGTQARHPLSPSSHVNSHQCLESSFWKACRCN